MSASSAGESFYPTGFHARDLIEWMVEQGTYSGLAPFRVPYFEPIVRGTAASSDQKAVRVWEQNNDGPLGDHYTDCYDLDGGDLEPTGSPQIGNTGLVELLNFMFEFPPVTEQSASMPVLSRLDTGEPVKLVRGYWSYADIATEYYCTLHAFTTDSGSYDPLEFSWVDKQYHPYNGGNSVLATWADTDGSTARYDFERIDSLSLPGWNNYVGDYQLIR